MADKVEAGDKVVYIPEGSSVADIRTGFAQTDGESFSAFGIPGVDEHTSAQVKDSQTGEDVGERVVWKR
jgi:hypothetical protein